MVVGEARDMHGIFSWQGKAHSRVGVGVDQMFSATPKLLAAVVLDGKDDCVELSRLDVAVWPEVVEILGVNVGDVKLEIGNVVELKPVGVDVKFPVKGVGVEPSGEVELRLVRGSAILDKDDVVLSSEEGNGRPAAIVTVTASAHGLR